MTVKILVGDVRERLADLADESIQCVVTSPPYWGLRAYLPEGHPNKGKEIGSEKSYQEFVDVMVEVFRDVRRVLRPDGTLWLNLGDCFATGAGAVGERPDGGAQGDNWAGTGQRGHRGQHLPHQSGKAKPRIAAMGPMTQPNRMPQAGLKPKDLAMMPARVALGLQADGWYLRQMVPWVKRNPMPESTKDRPTSAVEYVFQLTRSERYFYDYEAVKRMASPATNPRLARNGTATGSTRANGGARATRPMKAVAPTGWDTDPGTHGTIHKDGRRKLAESGSGIKNNKSMDAALSVMPETRALRNSDLFFDSLGAVVDEGGEIIALDVTTRGYSDAHFATFPPRLIEPLIIASCPIGGTVLDPFFGAGTTGLVADRLGRDCIGIDISADYAEMARKRLEKDCGLFTSVTVE